MLVAVSQWLHLTSAAVWVGSQLFIILVAIPELQTVEKPSTYQRALQVLASRYNVFGWVSPYSSP